MFECPFTPDDYEAAKEARRNGDVLWFKPKGFTELQDLNAVDIVGIFDNQGYNTYIKCEQPKVYLKDGVWYDGRTKAEIGLEPWQKKIREQQKRLAEKKLADENRPLTPKQITAKKNKLKKMRKELIAKKIISPGVGVTN